MRNIPTRYFMPILLLLLIAISLWKFPFVMLPLWVFFICFSLAISISSILKKHKDAENPHRKIAKDTLILLFTLLLAIALGGLAGTYANQYAAQRFGVMAGILSALAVSFAAGYLVRWGMGKAVD